MIYQIEFPENYFRPVLPLKNEWTTVLRANKHRQGKRRLKSPNGYCCLGILCEIQGRLTIVNGYGEDRGNEYELSSTNPLYQFLYSDGTFPKGVKVYWDDGLCGMNLATLNDNGFTFPEIADIIDAIWD